MKKSFIFFLIISIPLLFGCGASKTLTQVSSEQVEATIPNYQPNGKEPKIAVFDFINGTFYESNTLGPGAASMVEAVLVRSRRYVVVDRKNLEILVKEGQLMLEGITSQLDYTRIGQQLNLDYIVTGTVSEFGVKTEGTSFTAGVATFSSLGVGGIRLTQDEATARVVMDIKITDVKTGQIVYIGTSIGEQSSQNTGAGILLITVAGGGFLGASSGVQGFDQTLAGIASRVAAAKFVNELITSNFIK